MNADGETVGQMSRGATAPSGYPEGTDQPGRLRYTRTRGDVFLGIEDRVGEIAHMHGVEGSDAEANARRLAACWNAYIGWDTEYLERFIEDPSAASLPNALKQIDDQRTQELATLTTKLSTTEEALRVTRDALDNVQKIAMSYKPNCSCRGCVDTLVVIEAALAQSTLDAEKG